MVSENKSTEQLDLTFLQTFGTEMIDLYVGPEEKHFRVYKDLLCRKVPYFEKMFTGGFKEALTSVAKFPEDKPEAVDVLLGWVYTGTLQSLHRPGETTEGNGEEKAWEPIEFYKLADKLCLPELQDMALDAYIKYLEKIDANPSFEQVASMYTNTRVGSGIRKFAVQVLRFLVAYQDKDANKNWPVAEVHNLLVSHPDLALDYLKSLGSHPDTSDIDPFVVDCDYHSHGDKQPCYLETQDKPEKRRRKKSLHQTLLGAARHGRRG